jgi:hypothetical protein
MYSCAVAGNVNTVLLLQQAVLLHRCQELFYALGCVLLQRQAAQQRPAHQHTTADAAGVRDAYAPHFPVCMHGHLC